MRSGVEGVIYLDDGNQMMVQEARVHTVLMMLF